MSTKIYSGCVLLGYRLDNLLPVLHELRETYQKRSLQLSNEWIAAQATAMMDRAHFGLRYVSYHGPAPKTGTSCLDNAYNEEVARIRKAMRSQERDSEVDHSAEVVFFPLRRRLLAMPFIQNEELAKVWRSIPGWQDYGYWNSTDRPDSVTAAQWRRRQKDWDEVFDRSGIPSQAGFTYQISDVRCARDYDSRTDEGYVAALPSMASRVREIAMDLFLKENPHLVADADPDERISAVMRLFRELEESSEYALFKQQLPSRLPELSLSQLRQPWFGVGQSLTEGSNQ